MNRRRREFTQADKIEMRGRATDSSGRVHCEKCGIWVKSRKGYEFHHLIPEGMRTAADLKRRLTPGDGRLWCLECHGEETPRDVANIAEARRREAAELGLRTPPRRKIGWGHEKADRPPLKVANGPTAMARRFQ